MRLFIPVGLLITLLIWALYLIFVKKNSIMGKSVLSIGLFFGAIWAGIYWMILG